MAPYSLVLERATLDDIPALTGLWYAGFTDPGVRYLWPDTPGVRRWWDDANRQGLANKAYQHYMKVIDTNSKDRQGRPRTVAFAKWDMATQEERGPRYPAWNQDMPLQAIESLDTLVTHPEYRRRGAGSMLMKWGCDLADENGVEVYVDASRDGSFLYRKFGFVEQSLEGEDVPGIIPMARVPASKR
ncbi:hypothetical protein CEP52_016557 [Fusarium oligoseptatum]|uniref:N-acetyltransferase domain-containing protein n=2 Tax=Fusarium solani species complex TaxID=232080 RepID=A0A428S2G9_9HYPO|nr:hypothetical protein CEP51_015217 [Fusarium floridanum]RSL84017.1 hypothetical protein CEP52_016557 [Fusarium oligoseptatum]